MVYLFFSIIDMHDCSALELNLLFRPYKFPSEGNDCATVHKLSVAFYTKVSTRSFAGSAGRKCRKFCICKV